MLLDSQADGDGSRFLRALPSERGFELRPLRFLIALRRRLRWALPLAAGTCRGKTCQKHLDELGDHAAACSRSGLLKLRAKPLEKAWAQVMREAGCSVRENFWLRDAGILHPRVGATDGRRIEIVASGLSYQHSIPLTIDASLVSPVTATGEPRCGCLNRHGLALRNAVRIKRKLSWQARRSSPSS